MSARTYELIAGAAASSDEGFRLAVDLAAQTLDIDVNYVGRRVVSVVPDVLGDLLTRNNGTLIPAQVLEQRVLSRRQIDRLVVEQRFARSRVQCQGAALHTFVERRQRAAPCHGANAR